jgi:hypothetical protein
MNQQPTASTAPDDVACMGGFCSRRLRCARYHAETTGQPAERLCTRTLHDAFRPIRWQVPLSMPVPNLAREWLQ